MLCFRLLQFHQTSVGSEVSFWLLVFENFTICSHFTHYLFMYTVIVCWEKGRTVQFFPLPCSDIVSSAKFVMIVEKDATFQRLLDDNFCTKLSPCIIITVWFWTRSLLKKAQCQCSVYVTVCVCVDQGKGVPDVNSRLMVRKLWDTLHIPIFALVDADPHGTHHLSVCWVQTSFTSHS